MKKFKEEKIKNEIKTTKNDKIVTKDAKTKSKRVEKKENRKKGSLFKQIKKEMQKVHFPSRADMVKYSIATISFVIFFALYFYLIEIVMAFLKSLI